MDTIGTKQFVHYREVSLIRGYLETNIRGVACKTMQHLTILLSAYGEIQTCSPILGLELLQIRRWQ